MGVRVAEDADSFLARGIEIFKRHLLDLEVLAKRRGERLLLRRIAERSVRRRW